MNTGAWLAAISQLYSGNEDREERALSYVIMIWRYEVKVHDSLE